MHSGLHVVFEQCIDLVHGKRLLSRSNAAHAQRRPKEVSKQTGVSRCQAMTASDGRVPVDILVYAPGRSR